MPIYEYRAADPSPDKSCDKCRETFELFQKSTAPKTHCPQCGNPLTKLISKINFQLGMDYRAKGSGLSKLVKRDKGTYEKMY